LNSLWIVNASGGERITANYTIKRLTRTLNDSVFLDSQLGILGTGGVKLAGGIGESGHLG